MPSKQSHILTVYHTHIFAELHKQIEHWLCYKINWSIENEKDWM